MSRSALRALALAGGLFACRGPAAPSAQLGSLELDASSVQLGAADAAELESWFSDRADASPAQQFWAGWLLAQDRALRALDEDSPVAWEGRVGRTAHAVAALHFTHRALEGRSAAATGATPAALTGVDFADVATSLQLLRIALLAHLGFRERVQGLLDPLPGADDARALARMLDEARLHTRLRPHVWVALIQDGRAHDPARAFPLAVTALTSSDKAPGSLAATDVQAIEAWIEHGAPFVFVCPECGQAAVPQLRACPNDQTRLERFVARRRP